MATFDLSPCGRAGALSRGVGPWERGKRRKVRRISKHRAGSVRPLISPQTPKKLGFRFETERRAGKPLRHPPLSSYPSFLPSISSPNFRRANSVAPSVSNGSLIARTRSDSEPDRWAPQASCGQRRHLASTPNRWETRLSFRDQVVGRASPCAARLLPFLPSNCEPRLPAPRFGRPPTPISFACRPR